ncbi:TetR family transcriptional regulator [Gordonia pseudamarae]|jgi:AcrR family transcriptional regulator|uniref:TetR family transcriptional regulator n=1 Tax=Gordonia pseudamarae TaxID=2831662 RepID=A0ABX6IIP5_9ACTN|nr:MULTISPECIES: TetR/AcrR family transcriptional regulator [Gordonia]MBD0022480.1 TetR/AcrR family transcriptional regulator [Gordonia sp. (in: high G+C Gram-positive bacteria)]QHN26334.1 TetR family transcriptional regulator [Gordonia pseudamarae]QHN35226.1 TetR family transcriptional regulator [Gordonia pseudamarae]
MRTRGWQGNLPADSEEARSRILNAAIASVERHGVSKTTLADVANELGVTRQTVYRYFKSVNDMLAAVAQAGADDFLDRMRRDLAHVSTVDDAIIETILYCLNRLPDEPSMGLLLRAGQTELFTREATSESGISLGAQMLGRLPVAWADNGYDDEAMAGLAELVMRVFLSLLQYPTTPPRSDAELREFIGRWVCPPARVPR